MRQRDRMRVAGRIGRGLQKRRLGLGRTREPKTGQTGWRIEVRGPVTPDQARALISQALAPFDLGGEPVDLVTASGEGADAAGLKLI